MTPINISKAHEITNAIQLMAGLISDCIRQKDYEKAKAYSYGLAELAEELKRIAKDE